MTAHAPRGRQRQSGAILVIVMMVILGLLGLGITALWLTSGNLQVGANLNLRTQALYAAEAGVGRAKAILNSPTAPAITTLLTGTGHALDNIPSATNWDTATGTPKGVGAVLVDPGAANVPLANVPFPDTGTGFNRSAGSATAPTVDRMGSYTVWIRNDTAELRQAYATAGSTLWTTDVNKSVIVRSMGLAIDGRTNVVLEVSLGATPGSPGGPGQTSVTTPILCNAGKNSCDDNNSVIAGIVAN